MLFELPTLEASVQGRTPLPGEWPTLCDLCKGWGLRLQARESLIYGLAEADKLLRADFLSPLRGW
jgi:hypothetical protein